MFITLTIDTNIKKKSAIKLNKSKITPAASWRRQMHIKKRSLWQKFRDWRKSLHQKNYKLNGNTAMF